LAWSTIPAIVGLLIGLGHTLRQRGDRQGALAAFQAAAAAAPDNANLRVDIAYDLDELGRPEEAEAAAWGGPGHPARTSPRRRGCLRFPVAPGRVPGCRGDARGGGATGGRRSGVRDEYGHFLLQTGEIDRAEERFRALLATDPSHAGA
ncbi:MAG: hypothetical protein HC888_17040, partial [Candidatus Competibacteraceae bacterium]|nr:hypothetical protein [Candidatus Competibacteraceae bacterium]